MKISNILPQTPRTSKVDISRAPAARPGASNWGRPQGVVTQRERLGFTPEIELKSNELLSTQKRPFWQENKFQANDEINQVEETIEINEIPYFLEKKIDIMA